MKLLKCEFWNTFVFVLLYLGIFLYLCAKGLVGGSFNSLPKASELFCRRNKNSTPIKMQTKENPRLSRKTSGQYVQFLWCLWSAIPQQSSSVLSGVLKTQEYCLECLYSLLRRGSLGEGAGKKEEKEGARGTTGRRKEREPWGFFPLFLPSHNPPCGALLSSSRNQSYGKKPLRRREVFIYIDSDETCQMNFLEMFLK